MRFCFYFCLTKRGFISNIFILNDSTSTCPRFESEIFIAFILFLPTLKPDMYVVFILCLCFLRYLFKYQVEKILLYFTCGYKHTCIMVTFDELELKYS